MKPLSLAFVLFTIVLLGFSTYQALFVAPTEQTMGDVQRIFYYHAPTAWVAGLCFFVNFLASIVYLWLHDERREAHGDVGAERRRKMQVVELLDCALLGLDWSERDRANVDRGDGRDRDPQQPVDHRPLHERRGRRRTTE